MGVRKWWPTLTLVAGLSLATPASARWYLGGDGGVSFFGDSDVSISSSDSRRDKRRYNPVGFTGLMQFGYDFGGPRLEVEGGYRYTSFKKTGTRRGGTIHVNGKTQIGSFMVNGLYYFFPKFSWHPFVGGGIGVAHRADELKGDILGQDWSLRGSDWAFAYQGMAGLAYDVTRNLTLKLQYRYFAMTDRRLKLKLNLDPSIPFEASSHSENAILLGVSYGFP